MNTNTELQYWSDRADCAHATVDLLVKRYESATSENYQTILKQIETAEKERDFAEGEYDKLAAIAA